MIRAVFALFARDVTLMALLERGGLRQEGLVLLIRAAAV